MDAISPSETTALARVENANKRPRNSVTVSSPRPDLEPDDRISARKQPPPRVEDIAPYSAPPATERITAPIPKRPQFPSETMSTPIHRYNPEVFDGLPTAQDHNPHKFLTRRGDAPTLPSNDKLPFMDVEFPHAHVPSYKFFGNVETDQEQALQSLPTPVLALVIHGGGQRFNTVGSKIKEEIEGLLNELTLPDAPRDDSEMDGATAEQHPRRVEVHLPEMRKATDKNRFGQPWTWFVDLGPKATQLARFLLWQEVFAVHSLLSFSVHALTQSGPPWTVMTLSGADRAVLDTEEARHTVLANIKRHLWNDRNFCIFVAQEVTRNWNASGDPASLVKLATDTLHIECVNAEKGSSQQLVPAYLIYAKPISSDREAHKRWIDKFLQPGHYRRNTYCLEINKASVDCKLCKDTTHCARDCPLLRTPGWQGTTVDDIYRETPKRNEPAGTSSSAPQPSEVWKVIAPKGKNDRGRGGSARGRGTRAKPGRGRGSRR